MILNGCLAGLVAITAPCAFVSVRQLAHHRPRRRRARRLRRPLLRPRQLDDPVGALSVHLVNGVFGTLAVGLFANSSAAPVAGPANGLFFGGGFGQLWAQLVGVAAAGVYTFGISLVAWGVIKAVMGLRVTPEEEIEGLDIGEHGNVAYPDFQVASVGSGLMPSFGVGEGGTLHGPSSVSADTA